MNILFVIDGKLVTPSLLQDFVVAPQGMIALDTFLPAIYQYLNGSTADIGLMSRGDCHDR